MSGRLSNQVAIVTGGAQGIGLAIGRRLGDEGAAVILADIQGEEVQATAENLRDEGMEAVGIQCDVTSRTETNDLIDATVDRFGAVDILVNNAGIADEGEFPDISPNEWDRVIDVNLTGVFNCSRAAVPEMIRQSGGRIVNISSMAGRNISFHGAASYTASKWGVIGLTKHMAWDLGEHNITVNAICPGSTLTPLIRSKMDEDQLAKKESKIPLGRSARPSEQAEGVLYLVSDAGAYLTGTVLEIDGGKQLGVRHEIWGE